MLGWVLLIHLGEPISTQLSRYHTASNPDTLETLCWRGGGGRGGEHARVAHQLPAQHRAGGFSPAPTAQSLRTGSQWPPLLAATGRNVLAADVAPACVTLPRPLLRAHGEAAAGAEPCLWPQAGAQGTSFRILRFAFEA